MSDGFSKYAAKEDQVMDDAETRDEADQPASDQATDMPADDAADREMSLDDERRRVLFGDDAPDRDLTPDEQTRADDLLQHRRAQQRTDEERKGMAERERMASRPNRDALKLFVVKPADMNLPPFHFSDTPNHMLIVAETPEYARRLAVTEAGHDAWGDEDQVVVDEYKPRSPMVLTRDFRG